MSSHFSRCWQLTLTVADITLIHAVHTRAVRALRPPFHRSGFTSARFRAFNHDRIRHSVAQLAIYFPHRGEHQSKHAESRPSHATSPVPCRTLLHKFDRPEPREHGAFDLAFLRLCAVHVDGRWYCTVVRASPPLPLRVERLTTTRGDGDVGGGALSAACELPAT